MSEKGKEKKVELREIVRGELAQMILKEQGLEGIGRSKEGLVLEVNGVNVVVKTILKKEKVETKDLIETFGV